MKSRAAPLTLRELLFPGLLLAAAVVIFALSASWMVLLLPLAAFYVQLLFQNWKAAYWLLLALIPFSIETRLAGSLSTSLPDEPMTWLFLALLPLLVLHKPGLLTWRALRNPIVLIVGSQLVWLMVATAYSSSPLVSLKYLLVRVWLLAAFFVFPFVLFKEKSDFIAAFKAIIIPVTATIVIIMLRHASLGFGFMRINDAIGSLYYNHVEYSTIISMVFPAACIAWPRRSNKKLRVAYGALLVLFAVAIILSYARAAILAVGFAGLIVAGIRLRFGQYIMPVAYALIAGFAAYLIHDNHYLNFRPDYEHTYMHHDLNTHIQATFQGTDMSGMERIYRWIAAARMSSEEPVTGWGPNTFVLHYKAYTVPAFRTYVSRNDEQSTTHNYFLYLLAEQGWPGMLLYAALIFMVLLEAQQTYHRLRDPFYKRCTLGLAMMFAAAFVNNCFSELTDTHKVGAFFFLSIGLIAVLAHKSKMERASQSAPIEPEPV